MYGLMPFCFSILDSARILTCIGELRLLRRKMKEVKLLEDIKTTGGLFTEESRKVVITNI